MVAAVNRPTLAASATLFDRLDEKVLRAAEDGQGRADQLCDTLADLGGLRPASANGATGTARPGKPRPRPQLRLWRPRRDSRPGWPSGPRHKRRPSWPSCWSASYVFGDRRATAGDAPPRRLAAWLRPAEHRLASVTEVAGVARTAPATHARVSVSSRERPVSVERGRPGTDTRTHPVAHRRGADPANHLRKRAGRWHTGCPAA